MTFLVTGATGRVGGAAVRLLRESGHPVRGISRAATGHDLTTPRDLVPALAGVRAVFLVFPPVAGDHAAAELVEVLADHVPRIVYLSAAGTTPGSTGILGSHALLEGLITASGVERTFLRPSGFAANTLAWAQPLREHGEVRWVHGGARRALVHEADVAAVAHRALTADTLLGATPHLTGPEAISQVDQVAAIAEATGRPLRFTEVDPGTEDLFPGFPPEVAGAIVAAHAGWAHTPEPVTDAVPEILGRPAADYATWVRDHLADFR